MALDPSDSGAALALAEHLISLEQYGRALDAARRCDPEDPDAWAAQARAQLGLERFEQAERAASLGLERDPQHLTLLHVLGIARYRRGNLAGAEQAALSLLSLDAEWPEALCLYAEIVASAGQFPKAERLFAEASRIDPENDAVLRLRYLLDALQSKRGRAVESARELAERDPESAHAQLALGLAEHNRGEAPSGLARMRQAAALDPKLASEHWETLVEARLASHPLMAPIRWLYRVFGDHAQIFVWVIAAGGITLLRRIEHPLASGVSLAWLAFCLYTWIAPPLLRRWLERGR